MGENAIFGLKRPRGKRLPIVVSAPHVGTLIPSELAATFQPEVLAALEDTDWHVHELYGFCVDLGMTLIHARFSRYLVDLNRPANGPLLYHDQRRQTEVIPMSNFSGQSLYREGYEPDASQKQARLERYYHPYYTALMSELQELSQQYRHVLLFDAHSIRRQVPSITPQPFPDLIIGDRDGSSAHPLLTQTLRVSLASSVFEVACNRPFKGGQITRFFGQAAEGRHALQLEMSQDLYLLERTHEVDPVKAQSLQPVLADALLALARTLESL